jgi:hypothetical protein
MVSVWMWRLETMVSTYDEEAVAVSVVEKDVEPGNQPLSGGLPFEIGGGGLLLIKELTGGQDTMMRGASLLLGSFDSDDQGVEPLLEDLGVGGWKGDDVRWHDDRMRGGGMNSAWVVAPRAL